MMRRVLLATTVALAAGASPAAAQSIRVTPTVVSVTNSEIGADQEFGGIGGGLSAAYHRGRFGVSAEGLVASLQSGNRAPTSSSYDLKMWDLRATYRLLPALDAVVGAQARRISPQFAAQDVGVFRIGLATKASLSRLADIGVRGALLPAARFGGGGDAGAGFELGLGVTVGPAEGRYRALLSYEFQRIDREVNGMDAPLQMMVARLGVVMGFR